MSNIVTNNIITFGYGLYGVDIGTLGDTPAVFIIPNGKPGPVGEKIPPELQGPLALDKLPNDWTVLTFPTRERCKEVADALVGSKMARWSRDQANEAPCECLMCLAEGENSPHRRRVQRPPFVKRPVAFRIRRADADTAGGTLSENDWRYFSKEEDAINASDALGIEYQGLYVRDGAAIAAELEDVQFAIIDTLRKSAPGISETMRFAICNSIIIKIRNPAKESDS